MKNKIIYFYLQSYEIIFEWWGQGVISKLLYQQHVTTYTKSCHRISNALIPLKNEKAPAFHNEETSKRSKTNNSIKIK